MTGMQRAIGIAAGFMTAAVWVAPMSAQSGQVIQRQGVPQSLIDRAPTPPPPAPPPNYVIGPNDVLSIAVWREPDVSGDVVVRPDGKITMRIGDDIVAAGLTTDELKAKVNEQLKKFYEEPIPAVTISVKQINSRNVFITGAVTKPGPYVLMGPMTVLQLISVAGGLLEFADKKHIVLMSGTLKDNKGQPLTYIINYDDLSKGRNAAKNNIELRPGDTVIVR